MKQKFYCFSVLVLFSMLMSILISNESFELLFFLQSDKKRVLFY